MAIGKRAPKRSSSSTASTISTIVFIALCALGVWMLTANTISSPQTSTRTATGTLSNEPEDFKPGEKKGETVFEDNPGVLPNDAIQSDEPRRVQNSDDNDRSRDDKEENADNGGDGKSDEEQLKIIVEENSQDLKGKESAEEQKKQKEGETQLSEESTWTQNQQAKQQQQQEQQHETQETEVNVNKKESQVLNQNEEIMKEQLQEDAGNQTVNHSQEIQNPIPDEDKQQRIEQHRDQQVQRKQETPFVTFRDETVPQHEQSHEEFKAVKTKKQERQEDKTQGKEKDKHNRAKEHKPTKSNSGEAGGSSNAGIPQESTESKKSWSTQAKQSENEKERRKDGFEGTWLLCNETTGPDFIPCLDNQKALRKLRSTMHYEHRERHCPQEAPSCLVPLPHGYKSPIPWPQSRDKIWYQNVPHTTLAEMKGHQNWVKVTGEFLTFPGGGTQFVHGALHYIDYIQQSLPNIKWGKHSRTVLDVGCGVASFGGYLFERDVLTMSFAPKDEHEAQVQFALERGIPAISAVMGSQRLPFPSLVFDLIHCARCRVPWHKEGGKLLLELNRVLRPGGYFVWSATPVYRKGEEDVKIWKAMSSLTVSICWKLLTIKMDRLNSAGFAIYRKPTTNGCYDKRNQNNPPMCKEEDDPNAAWYVPLKSCLHRIPVGEAKRGTQWPNEWPSRLTRAPYWLNISEMGFYGKPAPLDFIKDYEHWKDVVNTSYLSGLGITWTRVRNVMDMRAVYGGFAAALKDLKVWVMNVVNVNAPDTLPIIYERGLFGIYHDWCESFSTYPRTYDLLHADHLFSKLKKRCKLVPVIAEIDRLVRPGGKLIVRDETSVVSEVENLLKSMQWEIHLTTSKNQEGLLSAQKGDWRPQIYQASS